MNEDTNKVWDILRDKKQLLGQVKSINENGFGFIIVYDKEGRVLRYPKDRKEEEEVYDCWFSKDLKLKVGDWIVFIATDSHSAVKDKRKNPYAMQVVNHSVQPLEDISEWSKFFKEQIDSSFIQPKDDSLNSIFFLKKRVFIANAYANKLETKIRQKLEKDQAQLEKDQSQLEKDQAQLEKDQAQLEKDQDNLEETKQIIESYEKDVNKRLQRWGLKPISEDKQTEEQEFAELPNEQELINQVEMYINAQGYHFERDDIVNLYTCFKTGTIVVLAGLSGTGKSSLVRLFAKAINADFTLVSVKATWNDDTDLLGFYHPEQKSYISTKFLDTIVKAEANPDKLFFVCLDEMNLSKIEYYFSEFLSVLEQDENERKLQLYSETEWNIRDDQLELQSETDEPTQEERNLRWIPHQVSIPNNLFIFGTINVDETTHPFSDKVLDRVQIIQFEAVNFYEKKDDSEIKKDVPVLPVNLDFDKYKEYCNNRENVLDVKLFNELNDCLQTGGFHFGHRVKHQIEDYCALYPRLNPDKDKDINNIVDIQIVQKILPKIKGIKSSNVTRMFSKLREFCQNYPKALEKIEKMEKMDPINYWELFRHVG